MLLPEIIEYATIYEARRASRAQQFNSVFLPMEILTDRRSGEVFLSVSLSGTGELPVYIPKKIQLYRIVKVIFRWLIVPATVSKILSNGEFEAEFSTYLECTILDGEEFWRISPQSIPALQTDILRCDLNNEYRKKYDHIYLSK